MMQIILKKNSWLWFKSNQFSLAIALLPVIYFLTGNPDSLTPFFAAKAPFVRAAFVIFAAISVIMYLIWLVRKPTIIIIDLRINTLSSAKQLLFSFRAERCIRIHTHSNNKPYWYRFHFENQYGQALFMTPRGYQADIPYQQVVGYLAKQQRPFKLSYVPWIFRNAEQTAEDKALNEQGEELINSKSDNRTA